jgi:hypothetical protein
MDDMSERYAKMPVGQPSGIDPAMTMLPYGKELTTGHEAAMR